MGWTMAPEPPVTVRGSCTLSAALAATNPPPVLAGRLSHAAEDFSIDPRLSGTLALGLSAMLQPKAAGIGGARAQVIGPFRVTVAGAVLSPNLVGPVSYVETEGGHAVTFELAERADVPAGLTAPALGQPAAAYGLPGGKGAVDLDLVYLTPDGPVSVPLMRNGVIDNAPADHSLTDGDTRRVTAVGAHGRYDGTLVEVKLEPGHGLGLSQIVALILEAAGLPSAGLYVPNERKRFKAIELPRQPWQDTVAGLLAAAGKELRWRRDGTPSVIDLLPAPGATSFDWDFGPGDWLDPPGIREEVAGDGPTRVTIYGDAQPVHEVGAALRTVVTVTETSAIYAPKRATHYISDASGTLTPLSWPQLEADLRVVRRVVLTREFRVQTLVSQRVETYEWTWDEADVGIQDAGGNVSYVTFTRMESVNGPARRQAQQEFRKTRDVLTRFIYDAEGFLVQRVKETRGQGRIRRANATLNEGDGTISTYVVSEKVLWSKAAVYAFAAPSSGFDAVSNLYQLERETTDWTVASGYVLAEDQVVERWLAKPGRSYFYEGLAPRSEGEESFQQAERRRTEYQPLGDSSRLEILSRYDVDNELVEQIEREVDGYLPAAEKTDLTVTGTRAASRLESQPIEGEWIDEDLERFRVKREVEESDPYVETPEEARAKARRLVREGSAVPVTFTLPGNVAVKRGQVVRLRFGAHRSSRSELVRVDTVRVPEDDARGGLTTVVQGRFFPV